MYTVYALSDPDTYTVHYVGVTNNLEARVACHMVCSSRFDTPLCCWLKSLADGGKKCIVIELENNVPRKIRNIAERSWIKFFEVRSYEAKLFNCDYTEHKSIMRRKRSAVLRELRGE